MNAAHLWDRMKSETSSEVISITGKQGSWSTVRKKLHKQSGGEIGRRKLK